MSPFKTIGSKRISEPINALNSEGEIFVLDETNERFKDSIGTYGLTYLILEAKLKINKINSTNLNVKTTKFNNYSEMLSLFDQFINQKYTMMGAWIDHFNKEGRGIFKVAK